MKTAVQQIMLGSVTNKAKQAKATLQAVKDAGYDGIELNGFMIRPTSFFVRMLTSLAGMPTGKGGKLDWLSLVKESRLEVVSIHEDLGSIERDINAVIKECQDFGTNKVVITGMYRFDYSSKENVLSLAKRLDQAGAKLKENGITLLYHNHNVELLKVDEKNRAYDVLIEETQPENVGFEFDSYWFTEGGADAKAYMQKLGKRMVLWHATDRGSRQNGASMTPILKTDCVELGTGNMDLEGMLAIAKENGVEAVVLESHKNWIDNNPIKSLQVSACYLKDNA